MTAYPVGRNTLLLAAGLVCLSGMFQLAVAVATVTLVLVTGVEGVLGLGPAIFLVAGAAAALPAGRAMDRFGRMPVIRLGFVAGAVGAAVNALGCAAESAALVVVGLALVGASSGVVLLSRAAAAEMYPPARRGRGMSLVLAGVVFGALLGPFVFGPLFAGKELEAETLVVPWLAAGAFMAAGLVIAFGVRPDPKTIAVLHDEGPDRPAEPLVTVLGRPGAVPALVAAVASFAVMVGVMNLTSYVAIDHGHHQSDVFTIISAHIVGMYGLVLLVGDAVDRIGRRVALVGGLLVMGVSTVGLVWLDGLVGMSASLFGLGLGWNLSYVAATAELVSVAASSERGRLVGFSDLVSSLSGAALALLGGVAYSVGGVGLLALGAAALVVAPAVWILLRRPRGPLHEPSGAPAELVP